MWYMYYHKSCGLATSIFISARLFLRLIMTLPPQMEAPALI